ncbi:MAG: hypothetical protein RJA70_4154 [Pseudomonadota bacterium]
MPKRDTNDAILSPENTGRPHTVSNEQRTSSWVLVLRSSVAFDINFPWATVSSGFLLTLALACTELESGNDTFGAQLEEDPSGAMSCADNEVLPGAHPNCPGNHRSETLGSLDGPLDITADTTWSGEVARTLAGDVVVRAPATLTILPGVRVEAEAGAMLLVERGAKLVAAGTRVAPVVFTSAKPPGERQPGDWRGVVLTGYARSHTTNLPVYNTLDDARAHFGGGPNATNDADCGTLSYVRVEFAGGDTNEGGTPGAALTFAGCGSATRVEYVQVHRGTDGLGLVGGATPILRAVISNTSPGDAVEWAGGYRGKIQYLVAQSGAAAGLVGNNAESQPNLEPVSRPEIYNATIVGIRPLLENGAHFGIVFRHGSSGIVRNSVIANFASAGLDLRGTTAIGEPNPEIVSHLLFWNNGPRGETQWTPAAEVLVSPSFRTKDPGLDLAIRRENPVFKASASTINTDFAPIALGFDATATYRGAVPYDGEDWTLGWTDFPTD